MEPLWKRRKLLESGSTAVEAKVDQTPETWGAAPAAPNPVSEESELGNSSSGNDRESDSRCKEEGEATDASSYPAAALVVEPRLNRRKKNGIPQMSKHDLKWNEMFNRLIQYKAQHHNCLVPQNYEADSRLGRWVHYQRVEFWLYQQQGSGKITQARIDKLESLGFEWDPQRSQWNSMFRRLIEFKANNGHCRVPKGFTGNPELANWVRNQRLEHSNLKKGKKSRMTDERKESLDNVGFKWSTKE